VTISAISGPSHDSFLNDIQEVGFESFAPESYRIAEIYLHSADRELCGLKLWVSFEDIFVKKAVAKFVHSVEPA
jgi:hypothetical protein